MDERTPLAASCQSADSDDKFLDPAIQVSANRSRTRMVAASTVESGTYLGLLRHNVSFSLYLSSMVITMAGEWLTYVASISLIQQVLPESYTAISVYATIRLLPSLFLTAFGGVLADSSDRRLSMIRLDCAGAAVGLLYLMALAYESLPLLYAVAFLQQAIAALYEPVWSAIVPQMVPGDSDIKKAITLTGIAWSVMAAFGTSAGGFVVATLGLSACFLLDSATYLMSACFMWLVGGKWTVGAKHHAKDSFRASALLRTMYSMTVDGFSYVLSSFFGPLILFKASGELIVGASDVVNVALSEVEGDEHASIVRLGLIFGYVGVGCLIGPILADPLTDMRRPRTLQIACIVSMGLMAASFMAMSFDLSFGAVCFCTVLWSAGLNIMWTDSSLLLQKYSKLEQFGRVVALDTMLYNLSRAASAFCAGALHDRVGLTHHQICLVFAILTAMTFFAWCLFHLLDGGAASEESDRICAMDEIAPARPSLFTPNMDLHGMSWVSVARESMRQSLISAERWFSWTEIELLTGQADIRESGGENPSVGKRASLVS